MVIGDAKYWKSRFINIDQRFLGRIAAVWPTCVALLPPESTEDQITINLVAMLCKDEIVRSICHWVEYQCEPFGTDANGVQFSKGKIDLAVRLDWERERYLAYECKRLNVIYNGSRSSLATDYVTKGMMRFMTEQYAEALPVGCMLGYVMDGDASFAMTQLEAAIKAHQPLGLTSGPIIAAVIANFTRFVTTHTRHAKTTIEMRHTLMPFIK